MDEPSGGTLRFSGHWILTNVFVTQADILTSVSSIPTYVKTSPDNRTLPYLFEFLFNLFSYAKPDLSGKLLLLPDTSGKRRCIKIERTKNQISQLRQVT